MDELSAVAMGVLLIVVALTGVWALVEWLDRTNPFFEEEEDD